MIKNKSDKTTNGKQFDTAQNKSTDSSQITQKQETSGEFQASLMTDSEHERPTRSIHSSNQSIKCNQSIITAQIKMEDIKEQWEENQCRS